jgi:acetyl esterase/lipase
MLFARNTLMSNQIHKFTKMPLLSKVLLLATASLITLVLCIGYFSPLSLINGLTSSRSYVKHADISFGQDIRQKLDVYTPTSKISKAPVVVFFYGGSWRSGNRSDYVFVAEALASKGIVTVIADYRLYPQVAYPTFLQDGAKTVEWTLKEISKFGGDPEQLFVMGHSAGAYNASMLALDKRWLGEVKSHPSKIRGWIGLAGPYNFLPITDVDARPVFFYPNSPLDSQPIIHVTASAPPALLIAPVTDQFVDPIRNTGALVKSLKTAGVSVNYLVFEKASHTTLIGSMAWPLRSIAPTLEQVSTFIFSDGGRNSHTEATQ